GDLADAVDVALDDVAAEAVGQADGPFEVHPVAGPQGSEARAAQRLLHRVGRPPAVAAPDPREFDHGQAAAVDGDGGAEDDVLQDGGRFDLEARPGGVGLDRPDRAELLDDAGEHADQSPLGEAGEPPKSPGSTGSQSRRASPPIRRSPVSRQRDASASVPGPGPARSGSPSGPSTTPPL